MPVHAEPTLAGDTASTTRTRSGTAPKKTPRRTATIDTLEQEAETVAVGGAADRISGADGSAPSPRALPSSPLLRDALGAGRPLAAPVRETMQRRLGHDFFDVRVHDDAAAGRSAAALGARAYAWGPHLVFGAGRHAPQHADGQRLLAHELAHVVQQRELGQARLLRDGDAAASVPEVLSVAGAIAALEKAKALDVDAGDHKTALEIVIKVRKYLEDTITDAAVRETFKGVATSIMAGGSTNIDFIIQMGKGGVKTLEGKLRSGQTGSSGTWNYHLTEVKAAQEHMQLVERNPKARTQTKSDPNALIPVADFITYVEAVEKGYPSDKADEIVTRIRQLYYQGGAFDRLIPGARRKDGNVTRLPSEDKIGADPYRHLAARADENAIQDNPSPYVVLADGTRLDLGHMLLGLDALIHTTPPEKPFSTYNVPAIDPASWVADLGIAAVWTEQHEGGGQPDSPRKLSTPDLDAYYKMSAPDEDLVGDIDSFALGKIFTLRGTWPLSKMLRAYYLGLGGNAAVDKRGRYRFFCKDNGFDYSESGGTISWTFDRKPIIERIDRFNDLFGAGTFGAAMASYVTSPTHKQWKYSGAVLDKFTAWLKPRLEAEIAAAATAPSNP